MRNQGKDKGRNSSKNARRLIAVAIVMAVLALGAMAAVSLRSQAKDAKEQQANAGTPANLRTTTQPTAFVPQTGQIRPLTQEEAQRLAANIKQLVNQSTDGLKAVQHADGSISMDLQGHFQSMVVTKRNENGEWVMSCVDNRAAAAAFFGIDPELVGVQKDATPPRETSNPDSATKGELR